MFYLLIGLFLISRLFLALHFIIAKCELHPQLCLSPLTLIPAFSICELAVGNVCTWLGLTGFILISWPKFEHAENTQRKQTPKHSQWESDTPCHPLWRTSSSVSSKTSCEPALVLCSLYDLTIVCLQSASNYLETKAVVDAKVSTFAFIHCRIHSIKIHRVGSYDSFKSACRKLLNINWMMKICPISREWTHAIRKGKWMEERE